MRELSVCPLEDLGVLRFGGPDAGRFLQGQLSNDVSGLTSGVLLRAGLHNPQGRTLALLSLALGPDGALLALLPQELVASTAATLRRYVLRAKVTIEDAGASWALYGVASTPAVPDASPAASLSSLTLPPAALVLPHEGARWLVILPRGAPPPAGAPLALHAWRARDIAAGLPQVYAATSGQFVAQMLNLDCIGAISFTKGCYTGQEVIARAHYRGRVRRRMQRFASDAPLLLAPGQSGQLADGRSFRVVEATAPEAGGVEFLAVAALPGAGTEAQAAGEAPAVQATALPLPYALPE